jgi:CubicO group peptidase (beta-lactamase class C family)
MPRDARPVRILGATLLALAASACATPPKPEDTSARLDAIVEQAMRETPVKGIAIAHVEGGAVRHVRTFGVRNAAGDPLNPRTIMYGASLTKAVFAHMVMQLVDEGLLTLDTPIDRLLPRPLGAPMTPAEVRAYADWTPLAGDERWRKLTPRILLSHRAGFANFGFLEPDRRLRIHFEPGARYAYSGDGYMLMQYVLEKGLGLDVREEMRKRVFEPFGMVDTDLMWRPAFAADLADGFGADGAVEPHDERGRTRAAGSMDTTIADMARFAAALARGDRLSPKARAELVAAQGPIKTATQFPTLQAPREVAPFPGLATALGVVRFEGPQGPGFYKGGHNDVTANTMVCVERGARCVVILSNDVRSEAVFPAVVAAALGETGAPWAWEYGDMSFWKRP